MAISVVKIKHTFKNKTKTKNQTATLFSPFCQVRHQILHSKYRIDIELSNRRFRETNKNPCNCVIGLDRTRPDRTGPSVPIQPPAGIRAKAAAPLHPASRLHTHTHTHRPSQYDRGGLGGGGGGGGALQFERSRLPASI